MSIHALKLCFVTNLQHQSFDSYQALIVKAIQGGVTSVQLRMKSSHYAEMLSVGYSLKALLDEHHIPLIINDDADLAKVLNAHLHLGPHDITPEAARAIVGPDVLIGLSIESEEELQKANELTCINYVAASAIFPSKTKPDCNKIWGLVGLANMAAQSKHPVVGIGGITSENVRSVIENGASGIAVVDAIHNASDPQAAALELVTIINDSIKRKE